MKDYQKSITFNNISCIAIVNNEISLNNACLALKYLDIHKSEVALFLLRPLASKNIEGYNYIYISKKKYNKHSLKDSLKAIYSLIQNALILKRIMRKCDIKEVIIVNSDHIYTNYLISSDIINIERCNYSVVAEGLMNYQDVSKNSRSIYILYIKKLLSIFIGFKYNIPLGHLSGAYENKVSRVFSFSGKGLKSPKEKVIVLANRIEVDKKTDCKGVLILMSGLKNMIADKEYESIMNLYNNEITMDKNSIIYIKRHPRVVDSLDYFKNMNIIELDQFAPVEEIISSICVHKVVSSFSTALVTIKIASPNIECIDIGAGVYSKYVDGFDSIKILYEDVGVNLKF